MLNRIIAPVSKQVEHITFIPPVLQNLSNGIPVYTFNAGKQELVRVEFIFNNVKKVTRGFLKLLF